MATDDSDLTTELESIVVHSAIAHQYFAFVNNSTVDDCAQNPWQEQCSSWFKHQLLERIDSIEKSDPAKNELARAFTRHLITDPDGEGDTSSFTGAVLAAIRAIAAQLAICSSESSIHSICLSLIDAQILEESDDNELGADLVVFTLLGWMTQLYEPHPSPESAVLKPLSSKATVSPSARGRKRRQARRADLSEAYTLDSKALCRQTITYLLPSFNLSLPQFRPSTRLTGPTNPSRSDPFYADFLVASNISFYSLNRIGGIQIQWTRSVCEHLDFDEQTRRLFVFTNPAYCAYMSTNDTNARLLDRFFRQYMEFVDHEEADLELIYSEDYFCEIIWTYRVIFSQNKRSWKDLGNFCKNSPPTGGFDPLFSRLISHGWRRHTSSTMSSMFDDLSIPGVKPVYSAHADFPYFGRKLLALQDYMNTQNPGDLRTLLHDRRDVLRFWTFWAVLIIGGISILLSFLQLLLSAAQVAGQFT